MTNIREHPEFYEVRTSVSIEHGLHARPCMRVVDILSEYDNSVWVTKEKDGKLDERYTDGKSIMQMMMLAAHFDTDIRFLFARKPHQVSVPYVENFVKKLEEVLMDNTDDMFNL